jgi:poly-gamma-glutamate capsule biosynthesis protein CapA/YwtB (metallophosphatase superfamily)
MDFILFLCGDVMLGRGIDQIFKYKSDPTLYESFMKNAKDYVPKEMMLYTTPGNYVSYDYVWKDLLLEPLFYQSNLKIINLETSITTSLDHQDKPVLYKMHPKNVPAISVANIDYCHMANNHVMDWGLEGLLQTIDTLNTANINFGGIGMNKLEAADPYIFIINRKRILIFSFGDMDSGIPIEWIATNKINVIDTSNENTKVTISNHILKYYTDQDFVIVSIHWGSNWGFDIEPQHEQFAHYLIDNAKVDIIHGHSSHHFRPIEIYHGKMILYGCGDLINDYETISDPKQNFFMSDISMAYFPHYEKGFLKSLILVPYTIHNLQLIKISPNKTNDVVNKLNEICGKYNLQFKIKDQYITSKISSTLSFGGGFNKIFSNKQSSAIKSNSMENNQYYYKYRKYKSKYLNLKN